MLYRNPRLVLLVLLTCLAGVFPAAAQQNDTRVALLIGNAAYPDAEAPLKDPVNNVRALADELRQNGFDRLGTGCCKRVLADQNRWCPFG